MIAILDTNSNVVARYTYDAWGKVLSITDRNGNAVTSSTHIANINPIRYRGYYYDTETGWYYLNSRYYDPQVRRFINADGIIGANGNFIGMNLFAYCGNNPIAKVDFSGTTWILNGITYNYDGSIADFRRAEQELPPLAYTEALANQSNGIQSGNKQVLPEGGFMGGGVIAETNGIQTKTNKITYLFLCATFSDFNTFLFYSFNAIKVSLRLNLKHITIYTIGK